MSKKSVWRFYWDCGRAGELEGTFVAGDADIEATIGKRVYFGEVLGKHSDICGTLTTDALKRITSDPLVVRVFEDYDLSCGLNPLDFIDDGEG